MKSGMKRDLGLLRRVLEAVEAAEGGIAELRPLAGGTYSEQEVNYHACLAFYARLAEGGAGLVGGGYAILIDLTPTSRAFLDAARGKTTWNDFLGVLGPCVPSSAGEAVEQIVRELMTAPDAPPSLG
jgi:hypothetical protein